MIIYIKFCVNFWRTFTYFKSVKSQCVHCFGNVHFLVVVVDCNTKLKLYCYRLILICCLLESYLQLEVKKIPLDKLGLQNNYNDIVRDLIKNWDSPIVYLRQLGYLPNDFEDTSRIKPNLDELISRMEGDGQKESLRHEHVDTEKFVKRLYKRNNCCHMQQERTQMATEQRGQRQALPVGQDKSKLLATKVQGAQHISDAKVDEIRKELDQQQEQKVEPMNVAMLGRVLAKQQVEMVQPQPQPQPAVANPPVDETIADSMDPSDKYLMELVAKTSPKQEEQAAQVEPAAQVAQVAVPAPLAIAPANAPATSQGFAPATSAVISPAISSAISPAIAPSIAAAKTNPKSLVKAPRVAVHLVDTAAKGTRITMPLEPISFDPIAVAQDLDDAKSQSMYVLQELEFSC